MNSRSHRAKRKASTLAGPSTRRRKRGRYPVNAEAENHAESKRIFSQNRMNTLVQLYLRDEDARCSLPTVDSSNAIVSNYNTLKQSWNTFMTRITNSGSDETLRVCCRNCKTSDFVQYTIQQTRSSDEGSTIFFSCTRCNARWRT